MNRNCDNEVHLIILPFLKLQLFLSFCQLCFSQLQTLVFQAIRKAELQSFQKAVLDVTDQGCTSQARQCKSGYY